MLAGKKFKTVLSLSLASDEFAQQYFQEDIAAGRLHALELNPGLLRVRYGFILNRNRPLSPAAGRLMDIIRRIEAAKSASNGIRASND
jgi:hypothetical protein